MSVDRRRALTTLWHSLAAALLAPAAGSAVLGSLAGCTPPPPPLRVGCNPWPGYGGLYLALAGQAGEAGSGRPSAALARLVYFPSTEEVLRAFRNRAIDVAAITLDEALRLAASGQAPVVLAPTDVSDGADVVLARPGIDVLGQLKGRRIAVETNAVGAYLLGRTLDRAGLRRSEVKVVVANLDEHLSLYESGQVDAVVTFEPMRSRLLQLGARELLSSRQLPNEIIDVLVTRSDLAASRAADLSALLHAFFVAQDSILNNREVSAVHLASHLGMAPPDISAAWQLMRLPRRSEARRLMIDGPDSLQRALQQIERSMLDQGLLTAPAASRVAFAPHLLPAGEATP